MAGHLDIQNGEPEASSVTRTNARLRRKAYSEETIGQVENGNGSIVLAVAQKLRRHSCFSELLRGGRNKHASQYTQAIDGRA